MRHFSPVPDSVPVLSRGRHRSARGGACFMEFASYLAGERWSDHPTCTHPALASLARAVNDTTTDAGRSALAPMIPSVVGLNGGDPRIALIVCTLAATAALPIAAESRQRALAAGLVRCEMGAASAEGAVGVRLRRDIRSALESAPGAEKWAREFTADVGGSIGGLDARSFDLLLGLAVTGIAEACITDPDAVLRQLLADAIEETIALLRAPVVYEVGNRAVFVA
ncbi:hypothetical protein EYE40_06610 [Glaciihabitans arcticus]|uniref:Uncharacterized protein n=1 Tax=Glaciihabitans arcticus TaxID=2668039 RepID=A0A4V2JEW7_9MICO|nr:hypothetical protein [Glaciihabitans arcticus]TBN57099.1 hypothetical protein EYE40_06610 [Glaciihabitans arcticus]